MSTPSIPDRAAALVNHIARTRERISDLRRLDGEWTALQLMLDDAADVAIEAMDMAQRLALRLYSVADTEAARLKGKK